jgi:hypothetical protein
MSFQVLVHVGALFALAIAAVFAFVFIFQGERIVDQFPTIKRFQKKREEWGQLTITPDRMKPHTNLNQVGQWRVEELSDAVENEELLNEVRNRRFGEVMTLVCYKNRQLRTLKGELRVYCGTFVFLFVVGLAFAWSEIDGKSLVEISEIVVSRHVMPSLELLMVAYLIIRLVLETISIKSLLDEE